VSEKRKRTPKQKNGKTKLSFLYNLWPLFAGVLVSFGLSLAALFGVNILSVGEVFTISFYGSFIWLRRVWQGVLASRNNRKLMRLVRTPLVSVLSQAYPQYVDEIKRLSQQYVPFDVFRKRIWETLGLDASGWKEIVAKAIGRAENVYIVAPTFKLTFKEVSQLIDSVVSQTVGVSKCIIVVNSRDYYHRILHRRLVGYITNNYSDWTDRIVVEFETRPGKRKAMEKVFRASIAEGSNYTINVDGDTYMDPDAVANAIQVFRVKWNWAAFTGDVRVINASFNKLTRVTALRYFYAFWYERAAQSGLDQVTCLSGPFLAIRTPILNSVLDDWVSQTFLGEEATYGDDRHISTLLLLAGHGVGFVPDCIVWTDAPTEIAVWLRQQLRWSKSGHRENWILVSSKRLKRLHAFIWFDLMYLSFFPFLVGGVLAAVLYKTGLELYALEYLRAIEVMLPYLVTIVLANWIFHSLYGFWLTRDWHFFLSPYYIYLYFRYLLWLKIWALVRLKDTAWGTK